MRLVSVEHIRTAINEMNFDDINQLLSTALMLITSPIETHLQTKFQKVAGSDIFCVDDVSQVLDNDLTILKLSRGFVDTSTIDVKIYQSALHPDLGTAEETEEAFIVNEMQGLIVFQRKLLNCWLRVEYTAGMGGDGEEYNESEVPLWLKDIAVIYGSAVFQKLVAEKNREAGGKAKGIVSLVEIPSEVIASLASYVRWYSGAYSVRYSL